MIYFKLESTFLLPNGNNSILTIVQRCEDVEYENLLNDCILLSRVSAKRMCGGNEPEITNTVINLTLSQYDSIVKINEPIVIDASELNNELNKNEENP